MDHRACLAALLSSLFLMTASCSSYEPYDTAAHLRSIYSERVEPESLSKVEIPFELSEELKTELREDFAPVPNEIQRVIQVLDFIFKKVDLEYSLTPTRNAVDTYYARKGNCLSFVNLFVGVARHQRLNPFYVEVIDLQRWNYSEGSVVSRGHIVAGMYVKGELETYDFLPYQAKVYKEFKPIKDEVAAAHFYNNLGAEALMANDQDLALEMLLIARQIAPTFTKSINNLGVAYSRAGELDRAIALYEEGLEIDPEHVALLTNLARGYQSKGRVDDALAVLSRVEGVGNTNPFFYVYKGELALSSGDLESALTYMKEGLRQDSEIPEVHIGLIKVYLEMGKMDRVQHHLSRALRLDATHPEARKLAAMLQAKVGDGTPANP